MEDFLDLREMKGTCWMIPIAFPVLVVISERFRTNRPRPFKNRTKQNILYNAVSRRYFKKKKGESANI